jgi:hypothetical protein
MAKSSTVTRWEIKGAFCAFVGLDGASKYSALYDRTSVSDRVKNRMKHNQLGAWLLKAVVLSIDQLPWHVSSSTEFCIFLKKKANALTMHNPLFL